MRPTWALALLSLPALAGACESGVDGTFTVSWSLVTTGSNEPTTCADAGTPYVTLALENVNNRGTIIGTTFRCDSDRGESKTLNGRTFGASLKLWATDNVLMDRQEMLADLYGVGTPLPPATLHVQSFLATWSINRQGVAITCAEAGATSVRLRAVAKDGSVLTSAFPCEAGHGASSPIPNALPELEQPSYAVSAELLDAAGATLAAQPATSYLVPQDQRAELPLITFTPP